MAKKTFDALAQMAALLLMGSGVAAQTKEEAQAAKSGGDCSSLSYYIDHESQCRVPSSRETDPLRAMLPSLEVGARAEALASPYETPEQWAQALRGKTFARLPTQAAEVIAPVRLIPETLRVRGAGECGLSACDQEGLAVELVDGGGAASRGASLRVSQGMPGLAEASVRGGRLRFEIALPAERMPRRLVFTCAHILERGNEYLYCRRVVEGRPSPGSSWVAGGNDALLYAAEPDAALERLCVAVTDESRAIQLELAPREPGSGRFVEECLRAATRRAEQEVARRQAEIRVHEVRAEEARP